MKSSLLKAALVPALLGLAGGTALASDGMALNPYSPAYGHSYRHGVIPTREVHAKMKAWKAQHEAGKAAATSSNTLAYGGGTSSSSQGNVGVMNSHVKVYLVFYGSGWGTQSTNANGDAVFSGDPDGAAPVAQEMFKGIGTGNELWSADLTQWCQGIASGSQSCPSSTPGSSFVPYQSNGVLAGVWEDTSATTPINATGAMMAQEAIAAAQHFGNTTPASNRYAYYVIMSAHGDDPDNYQSPTQGYCAWHDWNGDSSLSGGAVSSSVGDVAFSNQPYNMDMGSSCGVNFVNSGSAGTLDGYTMTLGHEWHEMMSDTYPAGGWTNPTNGQENSDECAWLSSGQGAAGNVTMGTGTFTEQSSWSNDTNECDLSHAIVSHGTTNATPTASNGSVTTNENTAVSGTLSASDTDGDTLTFAVLTNPAHGSVSITNTATGAFTYTPTSGFSGSDSFTFHATDSAGNVSNTATESVTVNSTANATPTASNGSVTTNAGTAVSGTLSASDTDGDALTFAVVANPAHGSVSITNSATGAFTYTPASGFSGSDSFTFHATDSAGNVSNTATESVTVNPVTAGCPTGYTQYTGSVANGSDDYQPNENYYYAPRGYEKGKLMTASGNNFDLYLYKWSNAYGWYVVAQSIGNGNTQSISYSGGAGYYVWDIYGNVGSGNYTFCLSAP